MTPPPTPPPTLASLPTTHLTYTDWTPHDPTSPSSLRFLTTLRHLLLHHGFFYLHASPLSAPPLRSHLYALAARFFALPLPHRLALDMAASPHFRGYTRFARERTNGRADERDQLDFATEREAGGAEGGAPGGGAEGWRRLEGPNRFPEGELGDEMREAVGRWLEEAERVGRALTEAVERAVGVESGRVAGYLDGPARDGRDHRFARMKIIRYPSGEEVDGGRRHDERRQGVGAHKDSGWLTLLSTSPVDGLEVQDPSTGAWLAVPYVPGAIVVNFGQQLEYLTRGLVQAATHRVRSNPSAATARLSIAWFGFPALDARLRPLDLATEVDVAVWREWTRVRAERERTGAVSDVAPGDLFPGEDDEFGEVVWRGLVRSHPDVVQRWYPHLLQA